MVKHSFDLTYGRRGTEQNRIFAELGDLPGWCKVSGGTLDHPVLVRFALSPEGALMITGVVLGAFGEEAIGSRSLRRVRFGEILADLPAWKRGSTVHQFGQLAGLIMRTHAAPVERPRVKPGPKGWPDEHFRDVAERYRRALVEQPHKPMDALAHELKTTPATARRWVRRARDKEFLGEPVPGKAGEARSKTRRRR
jgi:hypothetical protein